MHFSDRSLTLISSWKVLKVTGARAELFDLYGGVADWYTKS